MVQARDGAVLEGLVQAKDGGEAIPPVVARIFSGDSTSPLTREARCGAWRGIVRFWEGWCGARDYRPFAMVECSV